MFNYIWFSSCCKYIIYYILLLLLLLLNDLNKFQIGYKYSQLDSNTFLHIFQDKTLSYVGINSVGLRRRGFDSEKIREIQNIYRFLYQKNYNNSQACEIIEAEMEASDERDEILMFIKNSHRGIMKGYTKSN